MSKLFEIGKYGDVVCAGALQDFKTAKEHVEALQAKKAMYETWKLDIFINKETFALCVMKISPSAAYKKGVFEWGIFILKVWHKGFPNLEHIGSTHLASFPTPEAAFDSIDLISIYILHRYNLSLEINRSVYHDASCQ